MNDYKVTIKSYLHTGVLVKDNQEPKRLIKLLTEMKSKKGRNLVLVINKLRVWDYKLRQYLNKEYWTCERFGFIGDPNNFSTDDPSANCTHDFKLLDNEISFSDNISQHYKYIFSSVSKANQFWEQYVINSEYCLGDYRRLWNEFLKSDNYE